jgi:hypothetical protein
MRPSIENEAPIKEVHNYIERALGGLATLHLGPLDYNVWQTIDYLRTAAAILEQFGKDQAYLTRRYD